jgi:predicted transcriptional regulator
MKSVTLRLSSDASRSLLTLAKRFGMKRNDALSWVLVETAPPHVPKRGTATRSESLSLDISDQANVILDRVATASESSASVVVEAYLAREYR